MEKEHLQQIKRLIIVLAISGSLNIVLFTLFFYQMVKDVPPTPYFELKPAIHEEQQPPLAVEHTNSEVIRRLRTLTFDQLILKLSNSDLVENGYSERDLALACLAAFHHFDLPRALAGTQLQERKMSYGRRPNGNPAEIVVYPGLTNTNFETIQNFAKTERWPLTPKGVFTLLQKKQNISDSSLNDVFLLTSEFLAFETLFNRSEVPVDKQELLSLLIEGDWKMLASFAEQQRASQDLSPARRQRVLLDYIVHGSKTAAFVMLKVDGPFAAKKLDDYHVLSILTLLDEKTPETEKFAIALLTSPRSDAVWKLAATRLYEYAGEDRPENLEHQDALTRFVPGAKKISKVIKGIEKPQVMPVAKKNISKSDKTINAIKKVPVKVAAPVKRDRFYTIQTGDNLYRISKKFNVNVETLKKVNKLTSDALKPGSTLRIPA